MKKLHLMAILAALVLAALAARAETIYSENFEAYAVGTEMVGNVSGWEHYSTYTGTSTIVEQGSSKALKLEKAGDETYDMLLTPDMSSITSKPGSEYVRISYRVQPSSEQDIFALYSLKEDGSLNKRFFYVVAKVEESSNSGYVKTNPETSASKIANILKLGAFNDVSVLLDTVNGKCLEITCNGVTNVCNVGFGEGFTSGGRIRIRISNQYSSQKTYTVSYMDDILVAGELKPAIVAPTGVNIPVTAKKTTFDVSSGREGESIDCTLKSDAKWLSFSPESFTLTGTVAVTVAPVSGLAPGIYSASLTVDGGEAGSKVIAVTCQNACFFADNFNSYNTNDEIIVQNPACWKEKFGDHVPGNQGTYKAVPGGPDGSQCAEVRQLWDHGGLEAIINDAKNISKDFNVRVSFDAKFEPKPDGQRFGNGDSDGYGEMLCTERNGLLHVEFPDAKWEFPQDLDFEDKWLHFSFMLNTMPDNCMLIDAAIDDNVYTGLYKKITRDKATIDDFSKFSFYQGSERHYWLDNFLVEAVSRDTSKPELSVSGGGIANLGTNSVSMLVANIGSGTLEFETEVIEGSDWLSIKEALGSETYKGSLGEGASQKLTLEIDRAKMGLQYGRARIRTTSEYGTKDVKVQAQGQTENGYVFYASDFESSELGFITDTDPAFEQPTGEVIDDGEGNRCLKIFGSGATQYLSPVPDGLYDLYDFRFSARVKFPDPALEYSTVEFGTDTAHRQGEYKIRVNSSDEIVLYSTDAALDESIITNSCKKGEWFDLSYTYNADPGNRKLISLTFGDSTYSFKGQPIYPGGDDDYGWFIKSRIHTNDAGKAPYYVDDICVEAIPKSSDPPEMEATATGMPAPYDATKVDFVVRNLGNGSFNFSSEVIEGGEYLQAATNGCCKGAFRFSGKLDRSKMGFGFYRPVVRFTSDIEGGAPVDVTLYIQGGSEKEGYVVYQSAFDSLKLTEETEGGLKGELSEQDLCWNKNTGHNRIDIVNDPNGSGRKVAKIVNANDWTSYTGYNLQLNIASNLCDRFDIVCGMDLLIPTGYTGEDENAFYVTQDDDHRLSEFEFTLKTKESGQPVMLNPVDMANTEWWSQHEAEMEKIESGEWFRFYFRMNTEYVDSDHKTLHALNIGNNEFQLEGEDSCLVYPGISSEKVLLNSAMPLLRFWTDIDNAGICLDNISVSLVPKGLPEPAIMGLLTLLLAMLGRKRS